MADKNVSGSSAPSSKKGSATTIVVIEVAPSVHPYTLKCKDGYAGAAILIPGTPPSGEGNYLVLTYYVSSTAEALQVSLPNSTGILHVDLPDGFATTFEEIAAAVNEEVQPDPPTGVGNGTLTHH